MRILFTNNTFDRPAGTELSAADAISRLVRRGHEPVAFSRQLGEVAERIRSLGVTVVDDFGDLPDSWVPEIIHGQHFWETSLAALRYPGSPVLSFCRGATPWQEAPCLAPNVAGYVAVDEDCRDRLVDREGIAPEKVTIVLNGVDQDRFPPRAPLPDRPATALVFSNYAREDNYFAVVREACATEGIECQAIGGGMGNAISDPGPILGAADLVFAKGKAALEALVTGCGVIVCDEPGIGDLITPENLDSLRRRSFGYSCMPDPVTVETVRNRLRDWHRESVAQAAAMARAEASLDRTVEHLEALYEKTAAAWAQVPTPAPEAFSLWASGFFNSATHAFKLGRELQEWSRLREGRESVTNPSVLTAELHRLLSDHRQVDARIRKLETRLAARDERISDLKERLRLCKEELEKAKKSRGWLGFLRK